MVSDVRHEIWETTKDIIERTQTRWKIFLVRTEPIDQEDIDGMADHILVTVFGLILTDFLSMDESR